MSGNPLSRITALLAVILFWYSPVSAQFRVIDEAESDNSHADAQLVGGVPLPFSIFGGPDTTATAPDVYFFRIGGMPGQYLNFTRVGSASASTGALAGRQSSAGPLRQNFPPRSGLAVNFRRWRVYEPVAVLPQHGLSGV